MNRLIDQYLNSEQAAGELGICVESLQRLCRNRRIRFIRHGGRYRFRKEDLASYIEGQMVQPEVRQDTVKLKHVRMEK